VAGDYVGSLKSFNELLGYPEGKIKRVWKVLRWAAENYLEKSYFYSLFAFLVHYIQFKIVSRFLRER
jgi:hypothetical protein